MFKLQQVCLALFAVTFLTTVSAAGTSLQYRGNMKHPKLANHCYFTEHDLTIPVNETIFPTNLKAACFRVHCRDDYVIELKYCEKIVPNRPCHYSAPDYTKPYPECCPTYTCSD